MKNLLLLLFCTVTLTARAQVIIDKNIAKAYDIAVKKMKPEYQSAMSSLTDPQIGFAIYMLYRTDTLNKKDAPDYSNIKISVIDEKTGKITPINTATEDDTYTPIPCAAALNGDTLLIVLPPVFTPFLEHKITGKHVISSYKEGRKNEDIYRLRLTDVKVHQLSIPVKTSSFKLSTSNFKAGQIIYGEVSFETEPYYTDDSAFKQGYIYKKLSGRYVFKTLIDDPRHPTGR